MTRIYFVRHAEPNYQNHNNPLRELSPRGLKERELVTRFLWEIGIQVVLSSPYKRAVDTVADFAAKKGLPIQLVEDFKERRVDSAWIEDFYPFTKRQWEDFSYKLPGGESLFETQERNRLALQRVLKDYPGKNIVVGSHSTALSTLIHAFDPSFGHEDFEWIRMHMPCIAEFVFDPEGEFQSIRRYPLT